MESSCRSAGSHYPPLPPGFRFHPTDEELLVHYLKKRTASVPLPVEIIADIDLYKYDPWELPSKASFGEQEWYFFSRRAKKYPNGERPNRAATSGYWKATGTDKPILTANGTQKIGVKKALVFYGGKPPKGIKTDWIMHEYRLVDSNSNTQKHPGIAPMSNKSSLRLDDWVLCRIFKKSNSSSRPIDENMPSPSINGYHQTPISGGDNRNFNFFSGMLSGTASVIPGNPMSISSSSPSSQYWTINEKTFSIDSDGDNMNPSSIPTDDHTNLSFTPLLNHQFPQTFHQNSLPGDEILEQSNCQLPSSYFQ